MTGPRVPTVHPHRTRARRLLPFLAAITLGQLACSEQATAPQVPGTGPEAAVARLHPYITSKSSQVASGTGSSVRAMMSSASVSSATANATAAVGPKVLILSDVNGPTTDALANSIVDAGFHVGVRAAPEYNWFGTNPVATDFDVVIHLNGATFQLPLAPNAQTALSNFVFNGGGFIGSQWNGVEETQGSQTGMSDLVLLGAGDPDGLNCADCNVTYNTVAEQASHPVLAGVPNSFTFHADGHDASPKASSDAAVLMRVSTGGPAVLAREFGTGKVVNFSFAPNYALTGGTGTLTDPQVQQLYINAVRWLTGSAGTPGSGSLDSDADGVTDGIDNCPVANPDQLDTDADGLGDVCDPDADGDNVLDDEDNCELHNPDQADVNGNWVGDACEEVQTEAQRITFAPLSDRTIIEPPFEISASASSGLSVTFLTIGTCTVSGSTLTLTGVGSCTIIAQQGGNAGYSAALDVSRSFNITKAPATISVGTEVTYDGTIKQATVATSPTGLTGVSVTYTLSGLPVGSPVNAGTYQVAVTLDNPNYEAPPASGTLTIRPATPIVQWTTPAAITAGTPLSSTQLNATATGVGGVSLLDEFIYLPAEGAVLSAVPAVQPLSVEFISPDGNYTRVIKTVNITVLPAPVPPPAPGGLTFKGFFRPVHNLPVVNTVAAGSAIPVKFSVEGSHGTSVVKSGSPTSVPMTCNAAAPTKGIAETADVASSHMLALGTSHTYLWKTSSAWAGSCRKLVVTLVDGSKHEAVFRFGKQQKPKAEKPRKQQKPGKHQKPGNHVK